ncbi:TetR/AcrR family transcriptional regulator [Amycolatopsis sp. NPDC058986]|uniref:TetR/AcrR family transcriptional regulator n=1 Tax=unclassified Amycolatopsis TaxID=2618356 RepID=UPI00366E5828
MSEITPRPARRRRRADAERSAAAVLDAALTVLTQRPEASVEDVAAASGVSRQTVYAHFPSRDALLHAVVDRITAETVAVLDAARLDEGRATEALLRFLDAGWRTFERYPLLQGLPAVDAETDRARHEPVLARLLALVRRGQRSGEFDADPAPEWLLTATVALGHAAGEQVGAGRMTADAALTELRRSVLRVFGARKSG